MADGLKQTYAQKTWADVLTGNALGRFMARHMPNQRVLDRLRRMQNPGAGTMPTIPPKRRTP